MAKSKLERFQEKLYRGVEVLDALPAHGDSNVNLSSNPPLGSSLIAVTASRGHLVCCYKLPQTGTLLVALDCVSPSQHLSTTQIRGIKALIQNSRDPKLLSFSSDDNRPPKILLSLHRKPLVTILLVSSDPVRLLAVFGNGDVHIWQYMSAPAEEWEYLNCICLGVCNRDTVVTHCQFSEHHRALIWQEVCPNGSHRTLLRILHFGIENEKKRNIVYVGSASLLSSVQVDKIFISEDGVWSQIDNDHESTLSVWPVGSAQSFSCMSVLSNGRKTCSGRLFCCVHDTSNLLLALQRNSGVVHIGRIDKGSGHSGFSDVKEKKIDRGIKQSLTNGDSHRVGLMPLCRLRPYNFASKGNNSIVEVRAKAKLFIVLYQDRIALHELNSGVLLNNVMFKQNSVLSNSNLENTVQSQHFDEDSSSYPSLSHAGGGLWVQSGDGESFGIWDDRGVWMIKRPPATEEAVTMAAVTAATLDKLSVNTLDLHNSDKSNQACAKRHLLHCSAQFCNSKEKTLKRHSISQRLALFFALRDSFRPASRQLLESAFQSVLADLQTAAVPLALLPWPFVNEKFVVEALQNEVSMKNDTVKSKNEKNIENAEKESNFSFFSERRTNGSVTKAREAFEHFTPLSLSVLPIMHRMLKLVGKTDAVDQIYSLEDLQDEDINFEPLLHQHVQKLYSVLYGSKSNENCSDSKLLEILLFDAGKETLFAAEILTMSDFKMETKMYFRGMALRKCLLSRLEENRIENIENDVGIVVCEKLEIETKTNLSLFEVLCRLYFRVEPTLLPPFIELISLAASNSNVSNLETLRRTQSSLALAVLPFPSQKQKNNAMKRLCYARLLGMSGLWGDAVHIMLEARSWKGAIDLAKVCISKSNENIGSIGVGTVTQVINHLLSYAVQKRKKEQENLNQTDMLSEIFSLESKYPSFLTICELLKNNFKMKCQRNDTPIFVEDNIDEVCTPLSIIIK